MRAVRSWIFLAVAVLLAGLTGLALYGLAQQSAAVPASGAAAAQTIDVVVAKVDLSPRTVITPDLIELRAYPVGLVPVGALKREPDAIGQTTVTSIPSGQPIVEAQLSSVEGGQTLTIVQGNVLVAFPTVDPLTSAGLVNVGDHVDILATVLVGTGADAKISQTTIQNLEVLDVIGPTKEQPQRQTALVFSVDHQVALVLKYLRDTQTTIDLAVRSRAEAELVETERVNLKYLSDTYRIAP